MRGPAAVDFPPVVAGRGGRTPFFTKASMAGFFDRCARIGKFVIRKRCCCAVEVPPVVAASSGATLGTSLRVRAMKEEAGTVPISRCVRSRMSRRCRAIAAFSSSSSEEKSAGSFSLTPSFSSSSLSVLRRMTGMSSASGSAAPSKVGSPRCSSSSAPAPSSLPSCAYIFPDSSSLQSLLSRRRPVRERRIALTSPHPSPSSSEETPPPFPSPPPIGRLLRILSAPAAAKIRPPRSASCRCSSVVVAEEPLWGGMGDAFLLLLPDAVAVRLSYSEMLPSFASGDGDGPAEGARRLPDTACCCC